jgi:cell division protein FtsQ
VWNSPSTLNSFATLLYAAVVLAVASFALYYVTQLPYFTLREVRVSGELVRVARADIEELAREKLEGNFFTLNLEAARAEFETVPWVRRASARRQWPNRIEVTIEEHTPLARWGADALVNVQGAVFRASYSEPLPQFYGPAGTGPLVAEQYAAFRRLLHPIGREPARIELTPRWAWRVMLDDGMTLELGREEREARLKRFTAAYADILPRFKQVPSLVDLRYGNGLAIKTVRKTEG